MNTHEILHIVICILAIWFAILLAFCLLCVPYAVRRRRQERARLLRRATSWPPATDPHTRSRIP